MEGMRTLPWNILILSSSGRGHIPILLHLREQAVVTPLKKVNDMIFLGKMVLLPR
jgi:hypothetical protein